MFTGLIQQLGTVVSVERAGGLGRLLVRTTPWERPLDAGESIAVQGVCLTLARREGDLLQFDVLQETFDKTNLGEKTAGRRVNLERALRYGDPMGGHIVSGHVEEVGRLAGIRRVDDRDWELRVGCSKKILDPTLPKGSMALDGISLTVVEVAADSFTVHIIPYTWEHTSLSELAVGAGVNLEADILARYVVRALGSGRPPGKVTWEDLGGLHARP
jgi:riboflavin synthase